MNSAMGGGVADRADGSARRVGRSLAKLDDRNLVPETKAFALYLRGLRERTGLTSQRLESELGMAAGAMSRYLSGERLPSLKLLRRFQDWLGENTETGLTTEDRNKGRELLYTASKAKNVLVAHEIELEKLDSMWADRITVVEQNIEDIHARLDAERQTREKDQETVAELEERLAQLERLAALLQAERAAFAAMADAANGTEPPAPVPTPVAAARVDAPQLWGAVPLRNPDFVGRADLFQELRQRLFPLDGSPARPQVLHGLGGVGKTQLATEYIHRHADRYDLVWWIQAEHAAQVRAAFVELAKRLGIPASTAETAVPAVSESLRARESRRWLLVFDNAENLDAVRPFLPGGVGHVLVTSRNPHWDGTARPLEVDVFTRAESTQLLHLRSPDLDEADAAALADALGHLPAALSQIGSWLDQTGTSVAECLELLSDASTALLEIGPGSMEELPVAAIWNVSLSRLKAGHPVALRFLELCAYFAPAPIPRHVLASAPKVIDMGRADAITLNNTIQLLARQSLVKIDRRNNSLSLHPLLRAVVRANTPTTRQNPCGPALPSAMPTDLVS